MKQNDKVAVAAFLAESNATAKRSPMKGDFTMSIARFIPHGKENRISTKELMRLTGIQNKRALRAQIRAERLAGARIASTKASGGGYYIPETEAEKAEYLKMMHGEAIAILAAAKSVKGGKP